MSCFASCFRKLFKFCYNLKPCEREEKQVEANLEMEKNSSVINVTTVNTNSGSSQDNLLASSGDSLSNENGQEEMENKQNLSEIKSESLI